MSVGDTYFSPPTTAVKLVLTIHPYTYRGWGILAYCAEYDALYIQITLLRSGDNGLDSDYPDLTAISIHATTQWRHKKNFEVFIVEDFNPRHYAVATKK